MVKPPAYLRYTVLITLLFLSISHFRAQFYGQPADYSFSLLTQKQLARADSVLHTGIQPYIPFWNTNYQHVADTHRIFKYITRDYALDKVFFQHLIEIKSRDPWFCLRVDPILNLETGKDFGNDTLSAARLSVNTRGFIISGTIGKDLYIESTFSESQGFFPRYISEFANATSVIPGQGRWKVFKKTGYDYANATGIISWQACKHLNIQAGHGKQKIGDGYRSLLLSDNAFNYPYIRFTQQWWKGRLQYSHIYASLMNLVSASTRVPVNTERLFQKKAAAFQYLSINPVKYLNIGFFQGLIWRTPDERNRVQFSAEYFNPVLFTNLINLGLNRTNNMLIGSTLKLIPVQKVVLYGQIMADDLSNHLGNGNGWGFQGGIKYFDALTIKNLFLQAEYNSVSGSAYQSPVATSMQDYTHYGQYLGFTPGSGNEVLVISDYKYKRLIVNARYQQQFFNGNSTTLPSSTTYRAASVGYLINPAYNLNVSVGVLSRSKTFSLVNGFNSYTNYLYFSIRTSLFNTYYDF
ncbi:MAG: hypothetical protein QM534_01795 [Sediminibacterium sp.]|nr:hypothetical protein [Sediminibacterium sp.]